MTSNISQTTSNNQNPHQTFNAATEINSLSEVVTVPSYQSVTNTSARNDSHDLPPTYNEAVGHQSQPSEFNSVFPSWLVMQFEGENNLNVSKVLKLKLINIYFKRNFGIFYLCNQIFSLEKIFILFFHEDLWVNFSVSQPFLAKVNQKKFVRLDKNLKDPWLTKIK